MKTLVGLLTLVLALGLVAGPAVAVTHQMTGDVRAVNANAKTFTLEQHNMLGGKKEHSFIAYDPALLSSLKTGERVRVTYEKQDQQLIAREIHPVTTTPSKTK
jgi:Cu/Ag efflux protein CusF